jgi:hypothetical protein
MADLKDWRSYSEIDPELDAVRPSYHPNLEREESFGISKLIKLYRLLKLSVLSANSMISRVSMRCGNTSRLVEGA